jgi:hypothetical protein
MTDWNSKKMKQMNYDPLPVGIMKESLENYENTVSLDFFSNSAIDHLNSSFQKKVFLY